MIYKIERGSGKSAYIQLYEQLRSNIVSGVYKYRDKLPSKRLLAEEAEVSVITVEHAYNILIDEGYAESKQKSGYFVIYKADDFPSGSPVQSFRTQSKDSLNAQHTFELSVLTKKMRKVISDYGESLLEKSPGKGRLELREALCDYLRRSVGINVTPEQIVIGAGAEYLYTIIIQLLGTNRIYAIEEPCYTVISKVYRAYGAKIEQLSLSNNGISSHELQNSRASVLHVTPFNSYPSHISADVSKRMEYLSFAKSRQGYIIEDNYDSELTVSRKNEDTVFALSEGEGVIYLNTFSRTIAPSLRVGYMVLPSELSRLYDEKLSFYSCTVPVFEQLVIAELISSGDFERHINRVRRKRRKQENI